MTRSFQFVREVLSASGYSPGGKERHTIGIAERDTLDRSEMLLWLVWFILLPSE